MYDWKKLTAVIEPQNIMLPDTSKDFITKSYEVTKINSKGKRQERYTDIICPFLHFRLIKFTLDSILNIDPKTKRLQNEKKLCDIEEIVSFVNDEGQPEIQMKFRDQLPARGKIESF